MPTSQPAFSLQRAAAVPQSALNFGAVKLRYLASVPVLVNGPVSGKPYSFSREESDQFVDARDAEPLLRTRYFERVF